MIKISDSLRPTFPVPVSFTAGELPSASKLNGLERQSRQGQGILATAIGDIWNSSGDSFLSSTHVDDTAIMAPNLARYIGPVRQLNQRIPYLPHLEQFSHQIYWTQANDYEARLPLHVNAFSSITFTGTGVPTTKKNAREFVVSSGDYFVQGSYFYSYDAINTDWIITYTPSLYSSHYGSVAVGGGSTDVYMQWNTIPDPDTHSAYAFQGLKIQYVNGVDNSEGYYIFLPPRMPLDTRMEYFWRWPQHLNGWSGISDNQQTNPSGGLRLFWQDDGVACPSTGTNAEHYRYLLPSYITENWSQGATLPTGSLYLWDYSQTGTIVEGITFAAENAATPRKFLLVASGTALDSWLSSYGTSLGFTDTALKSTTHNPSDYRSGVRVICVGADISSYLTYLTNLLYSHAHSGTRHEDSWINHGNLANTFLPADSLTSAASSSIRLTKIKAGQYDDHPQYLHRGGSNGGSLRDRYLNAMLGDLCLSSKDPGSDFQNTSNDSRKIVFGSYSSGPYIQYQKSTNILHVGRFALAADSYIRDYPRYDSVYGYSASAASDGYGVVRAHIIPPAEWLSYYYVTASSGQYYGSGLTEVRNHIQSYDVGTSRHNSMTLRLARQTLWNNALFAHINLPYKSYCIVNVRFSLMPSGANMQPSHVYCAIGYENNEPDPSIGFGTQYAETNLYDVIDVYSGHWSSVLNGTWSAYGDVFTKSSTNPLVSINLSYAYGAATKPWIRIVSESGSTAPTLSFSQIMVLYRIKEF